MIRKPLLRLAVLSILCWVAAPSLVFAEEDTKTYGGDSCVASFGTAQVAFFMGADGGLTNRSEDTSFLASCPITTDNTKNKKGLKSVYMYVKDRSREAKFNCCVFSCSKYGSKCKFNCRKTSTSGRGAKKLSFKLRKSQKDGYYSFVCEVPPESTIFSYQVTERD